FSHVIQAISVSHNKFELLRQKEAAHGELAYAGGANAYSPQVELLVEQEMFVFTESFVNATIFVVRESTVKYATAKSVVNVIAVCVNAKMAGLDQGVKTTPR
ncbi:Integrin beta-PS-like protein, partial [Dinothrombium tinctorium]